MGRDNHDDGRDIRVTRRRIDASEHASHSKENVPAKNRQKIETVEAGGAKKKKTKGVKVLLIVLIVIFSIVLIGGGALVIYAKGVMSNPEQSFKDKNANDDNKVIVTPTDDPNTDENEGDDTKTYVKTKGVYNILLLGIDSSAERESLRMGWRSDVMMLCSVNFEKNTMHLTSIPRDMWVKVPKAMDESGKVTKSVNQRINTAYNFGGGPDKDGAKFALKCTEDFLNMDGQFNIKIDYFVSIDIDGLYKLADDLGGVDVVMDRDVKGVGSKGQTVTITSGNIDAYIRTRKGAGDDPGRVSRQQDYVMAVAKKIKEMGTTEAVTKLYGTITQYAKTNLTLEQCLSLAAFVKNFDMDNLTKYSIVGKGFTTSGGASVLKADEKSMKQYMLDYFYDMTE